MTSQIVYAPEKTEERLEEEWMRILKGGVSGGTRIDVALA